jgi:hypothetical protein
MRDAGDLDAETILRSLVRHRVDFVVVGALGATMYGSPLRTDDIDICPSRARRNLARLAKALEELNAREWDPHKGEAVEREWSADQLSVDTVWILVTDFGPMDLTFEPGGTGGYPDLTRDAQEMDLGDLVVRVASLADIIRSKESVNRDKDRAQLPTLRRLLQQINEEQGH